MSFEQIRFLSHYTTVSGLASALKHGLLLTQYDRWRLGVSSPGVSSLPTLRGSKFEIGDEFPGLFMSWHLGGEGTDGVFGSVVLLFPRDLIREQKNFHLNLCDKNGMFIEGGTFFHDSRDVPDLATDGSHVNEVVFHNSVPIALCARVLCFDNETRSAVERLLPRRWAGRTRILGRKFPVRALTMRSSVGPMTHKLLDLTTPPCKVFLTDINFTGIDNCPGKRKKTSSPYVRMIAERAGYPMHTTRGMKPREVESMLKKDGAYIRCFLNSTSSRRG